MKIKKYRYAVVIGRFQPVHNGHIDLINHAKSLADNLIVVIGSANKPITPKNPFDVNTRTLFLISTGVFDGTRVWFVNAHDYMYNDEKWVSEVHRKVVELTGEVKKNEVCLVGHKKDESSWYLDMFPHWHYEEYAPANVKDIHATDIREKLYELGPYTEEVPYSQLDTYKQVFSDPVITENVPGPVLRKLVRMNHNEYFKNIILEHRFNKEYHKTVSQYPRIEQTADAVVVQSGHVLLVQRKNRPGKGLWALPGGFVGQKEKVLHAAIRELVEETQIDVPVKTLYANLDSKEGVRFDHPDRDPRGRIITTAFRIHLPHMGRLTKVKGGDDAAKAEWKSFEWVRDNIDKMYADHYEIFERMVGDL